LFCSLPIGKQYCRQHAGTVEILTTIVVHSRDIGGAGVAHEVNSPKNQPQLSQMTMGQYR